MRMIMTQKFCWGYLLGMNTINLINRMKIISTFTSHKHSTSLSLGGSNVSRHTLRVRVGAEPEVRKISADEINGTSLKHNA